MKIGRRWWYGVGWVVLMVVACAAAAEAGLRKRVDLWGEWQLLPVEGMALTNAATVPGNVGDEAVGWRLYSAPGLWTDQKHDSAWIVRDIEVAPGDEDEVFRFTFYGAFYYKRLFVNGTFIGEHYGGDVPFVCTAPRGVFKPGKNQIAMAMVNASVVNRNGKCVWKDGVGEGWLWCHPEHFMPAAAHQGKVGLLQPAVLEILPTVYADDVFVRTSTRRMHLDADVEVINATDEPQWVYVRGSVYDLQAPLTAAATQLSEPIHEKPEGAAPVKKFWPIYQHLGPGERRVVTIGGSWCDRPLVGEKGPEFWTPARPKLYHLEVEVATGKEEAPATDRSLTRFGFREVWIEDCKIKLNGKTTFMGGTSFWDSYHERPEQSFHGIKWHKYRLWMDSLRAHVNWWQKWTVDAADELGVLVLLQPPLAAGATTTAPDFWARVKEMYLQYIRMYRNNPAIVVWATDNESTFTSGMPDMWAPSIPALTDLAETFRRVDPTRLVTSSHGYDLRGRGDFFDAGYNNYAYCTRFPSDMYQYLSWYFDFNQAWDRVKPIVSDEWGEGFGMDVASSAFGDIVYRAPFDNLEFQNIQDMRTLWVRYHQAWAQYIGLMETRKQGAVSVLMCFGDRMGGWDPQPDKFYNYVSLPDIVWDCAHKNFNTMGVYPSDLYRAYVAGRKMTRPYVVINESENDLDAVLHWTLETGEEEMRVTDSGPWTVASHTAKRLAEGTIPVRVTAGQRATYEISANLPRADKPQPLHVRVELVRGTNVVYSDGQQYVMFPPANLASSTAFVLLGGEDSAEFFKRQHAKFTRLDRVADAVRQGRPIVVGRDARFSAEDWNLLEHFVQNGGNLLVLARSGLPPFFLNVPLEDSGQDLTFAHPRARQHPITRDLTAVTAFWWPEWKGDDSYDDFMVARDALARPYQGNFRILVDAGIGQLDAGQGLSLAPMFEVPGGKGSAVFCSLMLQEKAEISPAAAFLLKRSVDYLGVKGREPLKKVVNLGVNLSRIYAEETPFEPPLDPAEIGAVVVSGREFPHDKAQALVDYARAGGLVIVHATQPETAEAVGKVFGIELKAVTSPLQKQYLAQFGESTPEGRAIVRWCRFDPKSSPLFDGMSHFDLNATFSSGLGRFVEKGILADVMLTSDTPGVIEAAQPGVLLVQRLGKGTVIYDQVLWDGPDKQAYTQARSDEYIAQMLSNAGVKLVPPTTAGGRITEWLMLGPFKIPHVGWGAQKHMELPNEAAYVAKEGEEYVRQRDDGAVERRTWTHGKLNVRAGAANNLNSFFGQPDWTRPTWDYYVAYLQAYIHSAEDQDVLLCGGADDSLKIYLNGVLVPTEENLGNLRNDEMVQARVQLKKGPNRLFVKCGNWLGQWGFIVKVKDAAHPVSFSVAE